MYFAHNFSRGRGAATTCVRVTKPTRWATTPYHVVVSWLDDTPGIVLKHYFHVRDSDFEKA